MIIGIPSRDWTRLHEEFTEIEAEQIHLAIVGETAQGFSVNTDQLPPALACKVYKWFSSEPSVVARGAA